LIRATCSTANPPALVEQSLPGSALQKGQGSEIGATGNTNDGVSFSNIKFPQIVQQSVYRQWADLFLRLHMGCSILQRVSPHIRPSAVPFSKDHLLLTIAMYADAATLETSF
jgi:hypothetical protein